jgi:integrase
LDGSRAAPDTIRLRRITLANALDFAVERNVLEKNPLHEVKVGKAKSTVHEVDRRSVVNPVQARTLLAAVTDRMVAFFALMYFAALRPEEAANLRVFNLAIPEEGWGEIHLDSAAPGVAGEWTDSGTRDEERALKHREQGVGRMVPCSSELTAHLQHHLTTYGTAPDGRLFPGPRGGGRISNTVYGRAWARARQAAFTPEVAAGPLARRPYDLRHAAVSTWLNAGVEATRVAAWAGHSVAVLLRVYAKCLDGGEQLARAKVQQAMTGR